jgi:hypothetical protein
VTDCLALEELSLATGHGFLDLCGREDNMQGRQLEACTQLTRRPASENIHCWSTCSFADKSYRPCLVPCRNFFRDTVALSFVCGNYCQIMD